jgi:adenylyltransferase/sulfurtransferase
MSYANAEELITDVDLVLDGTDNFEARFLINDAAVKLGKPWVYGAVVGSYGVQMTIRPHLTPCLRCIFPDMPPPGSPTCDTAGVILPAVASIASFQVTEALKLLTGRSEGLHGALVQVDIWENRSTRAALGPPEPACPACGLGRFDHLSARGGQLATTLCGRNAVQIAPGSRKDVDLEALAKRLRGIGELTYNRFLVRLSVEGCELTVFPDGRCIVKGTEDASVARSLYARYIGG